MRLAEFLNENLQSKINILAKRFPSESKDVITKIASALERGAKGNPISDSWEQLKMLASWKSKGEIEKVEETQNVLGKKLIYENVHCQIYLITTHQAARQWFKKTKWCITTKNPFDYWIIYKNSTFYFIDSDLHSPFNHMAVERISNGRTLYWSATDDKEGKENIANFVKVLKIPENIFKYVPRIKWDEQNKLYYGAKVNKGNIKEATRKMIENGDNDLYLKMTKKKGITEPPTNEEFADALRGDNIELVKEFIRVGANVNKELDGNMREWLPLSYCQSTDMMEVLIQAGADVNGRNHLFKRPVIVSACSDDENDFVFAQVMILVKYKVKINAKDKYGNTALLMAASNDNEKAVRYLLKHGANPNVKDNHDYTPYKVAGMNENYKMQDLLLKYGAKG